MSIGSVLFGVAVLAVVVAYLAQPFLRLTAAGVDRTIEAWVAEVRAEELGSGQDRREAGDMRLRSEGAGDKTGQLAEGREAQAVNYCPQCGRRVESDDRFCSGCGTRLSRGGA